MSQQPETLESAASRVFGQTDLRSARLQAKVECGIGETVVVIPEGMEARIAVDTGLAGREIPPGYEGQDDIYTSPGYEGAENRVDLEVRQAIGMLRISDAG